MTSNAGFLRVLIFPLACVLAGGRSVSAQQLRIVEPSADSAAIRVTRGSSSFRLTLRIAGDSAARVDSLRAEVSPLAGPDTFVVRPRSKLLNSAAESTATVPARGAVYLEIVAELPRLGKYIGDITLLYAGRRESRGLVLVRELGASPLRIPPLPRVRAAGAPFSRPRAWVSIEDTLDEARWIYTPTLTSLSLDAGNSTREQAAAGKLEIRDLQSDSARDPLSLHDSLLVPAGGSRTLEVTLPRVWRAGEYAGALRVGTRNGRPIEVPITLLVKHCWVIATFLIALGVGASYLLRRWRQVDRPRLVRRRRALLLRERLDAISQEHPNRNAVAAELLDYLRHRVDQLDAAIRDEIDPDPANDAALDELKTKLELVPNWLILGGRVAELEPAELRRPFAAELDGVRDYIRKSPVSAEETKRSQDLLATMDTRITTAAGERLGTAITDFKRDLEAELAARTVQEDIAKRVRTWIEDLTAAVADVAAKRFEEASNALERVRQAYAELLMNELVQRLADPAVPAGFEQKGWDSLRLPLSERLHEVDAGTTEEKIAAYTKVQAQYLAALAAGLKAGADVESARVSRLGQLSGQAKTTLETRLEAVRNTAAAIQQKLLAGDARGATTLYEGAARDLRAIENEVVDAGGARQLGGPGQPVPGPTYAAGALPDAVATIARSARRSSREKRVRAALNATVQSITDTVKTHDLAFNAVILVVAVLLGLELLWVPNATWGGWADGLAAVLWGLSLHQVSGVAFQGTSGLAAGFDK